MKILAVCQSGLGTSLMVQMNVEQVLQDENVKANIEVNHADVGSATPDSADYFFIESTLEDAMRSIPQEKVVLLKSLIDMDELKGHVNDVLKKENIDHD